MTAGSSTFVKICGITRLIDARAAVRAGANAIGFVFAPSPRRISPLKAADIAARVHPCILKFGVFVGASAASIARAVDSVGLDGVQLHGNAEPLAELRVSHPNLLISKVLKPSEKIEDLEPPTDLVFVDPKDPADPSATSRPIALKRLMSADLPNMVVAGGLTPRNVGKVVELVTPYGVDVSGGVEESPGKKDPALVRAFVESVRRAEARVA